jgi:hypothetical protein
VGTRLTPPPFSIPPETGEIDESWEDLVIGALGTEPPAEVDAGVFDRPTAIPAVPPSRLELDFSSSPPSPASAHSAKTVAPEPGFRITLEPDPRLPARLPVPGPARDPMPEDARKQTVPEPPVERNLERVAAGVVAVERDRSSEPSLEITLEPESSSPLDLVETYRRSVASMPAVRAPGTEPQGEKSQEGGNHQDMQDRYAVGDFTGALVVAESLLDADPENEDAKRYAQSCREVLTQMYAARIGPMEQVATVAVPPDQITWLSLDHRAGFLLSLVDGVSSIDEILDISGMTRLDALRIMYTLVQQNVITLTH